MRLSLPIKLITLPILALVFVFLLSLITANKADAGSGWGWVVALKQNDVDNCGAGNNEMLVFAQTFDYANPNTVVNAGNITLSGGSPTTSGVRQTGFSCFQRSTERISITVAGNATWHSMSANFGDGDAGHDNKTVKVKILVKRQFSPHTVKNVSPLSGWVNTRSVTLTANVNGVHPLSSSGNVATCIDDVFFNVDFLWQPVTSVVPCRVPPFNIANAFDMSDGVHFWNFEASDNAYSGRGKISAFSGANMISIDATDPLIVTTSHTPSTVYDSDTVTFSARAQDATSGLRWIEIARNINSAGYVSFPRGFYLGPQDRTLSRNGGPFPAGTRVCYRARARDIAANISSWTTPRCFDVRAVAKPDYIPDFIIGPTSVEIGDTVTYTSATTNFGVAASVASRSVAFSWLSACSPFNENFTVPPLSQFQAAAGHSYTCTWTAVGTWLIRYQVDADNDIDESDETNNAKTLVVTVTSPLVVPLPCPAIGPGLGDVNFDGGISIVDSTWIVEHVSGTRSFSPTQLIRADVNGDGLITVLDAFEILIYIGGGPDFTGCLPPAAPDLEPTILNVVGTLEVDETLDINGTIVNNSLVADAGPSFARFCEDNSSCLTTATGILGGGDIGPIAISAGSSQSFPPASNILWTPTAAASYTITLCADVGTDVLEFDETNNCISKTVIISAAVPKPWIQTRGGNVGVVGGEISNPRPAISGEFNSDFIVLITGTRDNFTSARDWLVGSAVNNYDFNTNIILDYDELKAKYAPSVHVGSNTIPSDEAFEYTGTFTINSSTDLGSGMEPTVFFIRGHLVIKRDQVDISRPILFIVRGKIFVNQQVETMNGFYLTDDEFRTKDDPSSDTDQLVVNGSVIAHSFDLKRNLEGKNDDDPAEKFIYQPSYLYHFKDLLGDPRATFEEVAP